jgi:hypothetical protein
MNSFNLLSCSQGNHSLGKVVGLIPFMAIKSYSLLASSEFDLGFTLDCNPKRNLLSSILPVTYLSNK